MWTVVCDKDDVIRVVDRDSIVVISGHLVVTTKEGKQDVVYLPRGIELIHELPLFGTMRGALPFLLDYYSC